jgi:hypothetical protein
MIVTDRFVFVHIPKTGGTFIQTVIAEHLPVVDHEPMIGDATWSHTPYGDLPAEWRSLPAFCVVRNPWDWYVSWFHYQVDRGPRRRPAAEGRDPWGKHAVWTGALRSGEADFKEAVTRACTGAFDHPLAPVMREQGLDFYSARVQEIAGPAVDQPNFTVLRFERLRRQLARYLRRHADPPPELLRAIRREPRKLASEHGPYQDYYDEELRELVGEKTAWLCERFGYRFE